MTHLALKLWNFCSGMFARQRTPKYSVTFLAFFVPTVVAYYYAKPPADLLWFPYNYRVSFDNSEVSSVTPCPPQLPLSFLCTYTSSRLCLSFRRAGREYLCGKIIRGFCRRSGKTWKQQKRDIS